MEERRTAREDPAVWEGLGCTAEGSLGADCSLEEAGRNLAEVHRTAVAAGRTAEAEAGRTVAEEVGHRGRHHSIHQTYHGHQVQHRRELRESHRGEAANLESLSKWSEAA